MLRLATFILIVVAIIVVVAPLYLYLKVEDLIIKTIEL